MNLRDAAIGQQQLQDLRADETGRTRQKNVPAIGFGIEHCYRPRQCTRMAARALSGVCPVQS